MPFSPVLTSRIFTLTAKQISVGRNLPHRMSIEDAGSQASETS